MPPQSSLDPVVIHLRRGRVALLLAGSMVFVALGLWLLLPPYTNTGFDELVAACGAILFFGLAAMFTASRLLSRRPALVIDASGITDNASALAAGFIPWSDFAGAGIAGTGKARFLGIRLREPQAFLDRCNPLKRFLVRISMAIYGSPCNIPVVVMSCSAEELLATVERHARQRLSG